MNNVVRKIYQPMNYKKEFNALWFYANDWNNAYRKQILFIVWDNVKECLRQNVK